MSIVGERAALPDDELHALVGESVVFGVLDPEAQAFVVEHLEPQAVRGGETLVRQDEVGDCLYLVAVGRFRITIVRDDGSEVQVAEVGRGDTVGELALITSDPRSATVTALRDSHVLRLSTESYEQLVLEHPRALRLISTPVVRRLVRSFREGPSTTPVVSIAVVPLDRAEIATDVARRLHVCFERMTGGSRHLTVAATSALGDLEHVSDDRLARWFAQQELDAEVVLYEADEGTTPWTEACLRQADLVLLVGSDRVPERLLPVEEAVARRRALVPNRTELVIVHPPSTRHPRRTSLWFESRQIDRHHHVRRDRDGDYARVARLLLGRGIGVVFGGGGARGLAEIGVLRALVELDVPIDAVGGTSIGSIIGGAAARGDDPAELERMMRAAVVESSPFDVTLPLVSLTAGARVSRHLQEAADGLDLEDVWRSFFCVSTNLTTGGVEVHRRGSAWYAIRSSFSIPGIFPPARNEAGELLVDGGVLDNLPVATMRHEHTGTTVIAVDVGRTRDLRAGSLPGTGIVSGWRVLRDRIESGKAKAENPGIGRVLMRLTELGSEQNGDLGDVHVRPAVDPFGIGDFKACDRLVALGYSAGIETLTEWRATTNVALV